MARPFPFNLWELARRVRSGVRSVRSCRLKHGALSNGRSAFGRPAAQPRPNASTSC